MKSGSVYRLLVLVTFLGLEVCVAEAATAKQQCAPIANAQNEVVDIIKQMYVAARADDLPALVAVTTPDFYAYDGGKRFTAQTLMDLIKKLHAAGKHYEWNVTDPEVHIACNLAWATYVNRGSIEDAAGRQDMTWLESGVLEYRNGHWRMCFFHSTRVPGTQ
jgi:ketosteroid isomerase-like protein